MRFFLNLLMVAAAVVQAQVACTPGVGRIVSIVGSSLLGDAAQEWAAGFRQYCNYTTNQFNVDGNRTTTAGLQRLCGVPTNPNFSSNSSLPTVDMALVVDELLLSSNGTIQVDTNTSVAVPELGRSKCIQGVASQRPLLKMQVASNGIVAVVAANGTAAQCIQKMGGLSLGQLRWIFSSYNYSQLVATGLSLRDVPNNDGSDRTRRWNELNANCTAGVEIVSTMSWLDPDAREFLAVRILKDRANGETFRPASPLPTWNIHQLPIRPNAIGLVDFATFRTQLTLAERNKLRLVPVILSLDPIVVEPVVIYATFVTPNVNSISNGYYPLTFHLSFLFRADDLPLLTRRLLSLLTFAFSNLGDVVSELAGLIALTIQEKLNLLGSGYAFAGPTSNRCTCGLVGVPSFAIAGDPTTFNIALGWKVLYQQLCPSTNITLRPPTSSSDGAAKVCGFGGFADVGNMNRNFINATEARPTTGIATFRCVKGTTPRRKIRQVKVATRCKNGLCNSLYMNLNAAAQALQRTSLMIKCGFTPTGDNLVYVTQSQPLSAAQKDWTIQNVLIVDE